MFHGRVVAQAHLIPWQQNSTHMLEFARVAIALAGLKIIAKASGGSCQIARKCPP